MLSLVFANDLAKLILQGVGIAGIADPAASSPLANIVVALHSADPGSGGSQTTNELAYTGYGRVAVPRTDVAWIVTDNIGRPAGRIEFGQMTDGAEVLATHVSFGTSLTGTGKVLMRAALSPTIQCRLGVVPAVGASTSLTFLTS